MQPILNASHQPIKSQSDNQTVLKPQGCVLAFDFGEKRIGVAVGEHLLGIAHPLITIESETNDERFRSISELITEWRPSLLVVGLPLTTEGEEHALTLLSKKFSRRLGGRFDLPVVMVDERYTSVEASRTLKEMSIYLAKRVRLFTFGVEHAHNLFMLIHDRNNDF